MKETTSKLTRKQSNNGNTLALLPALWQKVFSTVFHAVKTFAFLVRQCSKRDAEQSSGKVSVWCKLHTVSRPSNYRIGKEEEEEEDIERAQCGIGTFGRA